MDSCVCFFNLHVLDAQAARFVLEEAAGSPSSVAWGQEVEALLGLLERAMEVGWMHDIMGARNVCA